MQNSNKVAEYAIISYKNPVIDSEIIKTIYLKQISGDSIQITAVVQNKIDLQVKLVKDEHIKLVYTLENFNKEYGTLCIPKGYFFVIVGLEETTIPTVLKGISKKRDELIFFPLDSVLRDKNDNLLNKYDMFYVYNLDVLLQFN